MNSVNFEDLEGDAPSSRSVSPGVERAHTGPKCGTTGSGFFHEAERLGIKAAMRFKVADRKAYLIYSLMA
jgi:hypothetical protein